MRVELDSAEMRDDALAIRDAIANPTPENVGRLGDIDLGAWVEGGEAIEANLSVGGEDYGAGAGIGDPWRHRGGRRPRVRAQVRRLRVRGRPMMTFDDPLQLCTQWLPDPDVAAIEWQPEAPASDRVERQWRGSDGETLTLFAPEPRSADELLTADVAALLAGGTFRPGEPLRDGQRLRGNITADAPAGPARLDVAAIDAEGGARRLVLQRPLAPESTPSSVRGCVPC